jgi:thiamine-phosphate pyrophosphorylase
LSESPIDRLWRSARAIGREAGSAGRLPPLLYFTDPVRTPAPERILARLPRGAAIVFRAFGAPDAVARGAALARLARRRGVMVLVGADAGLAVALRADGVHLPQRLAGRAGAIGALRRRFLVTAAAHDLPAALRAQRAGVDAVVVSTVFASRSASAGKAMGVLAFAALVRRLSVPVYGLGGVRAGNARRLAHSRAAGLAAVDGLAGP